MNVKIQCSCGQKFAFDVEPANGQMPWQVNCPGCGTDQTNAANEIIARELNAPPRLKLPNQPEPPRIAAEPGLVGRYGTVASNAARLRVNWAKANATRPAALVLSIVLILFGLMVCCTLKPAWVGLIFIVTAIIVWRRHYREVRQKFYAGDVCPGIVLSDKLVAVMTDLRTGAAVRPCIKVMRYPLSKMTEGLPAVGSRVATVALYRGPARDGAWQDFWPEVIGCWVRDENEIQRVTHSITELEWRNLDALLERIPKLEPGLYKMWGANPSKAKGAMDPAVEMVLALLILGALFAGPAYAVVHQWKLKHPMLNASSAAAQPPPEEIPAVALPNVTRPATPAPAPRPTIAATTSPKPTAPAKPAVPTAIDLGGRFTTFTNLQGKSFEQVRLVKADPRAGLVYSFDGGEGSVALNTLPLEFLEQIGVPTNWPSVRQGRAIAAAPAAAGTPTPKAARFAVGNKVEVQWGGKWEPANIVGFDRFNIIVHFTDPASFVRNDLRVPTNWVRMAP